MTDDLNCYPFLAVAAILAAITEITSVCDVAQNIRKSTEKTGEQDVLLAPSIILLVEHLHPCSPCSRAYQGFQTRGLFCQNRVSGLERYQTRVSGRVRVWEDGDRVQVKLRMKFAICG